MVIGLFGFWITLMATGGTFSTETDYKGNDTEAIVHRSIENIRDNQRITSYKKKRKIELLFYIFTVLTAALLLLTDVLLAFDAKNRMAACLLWIWAHIWWIFICLAQVIRGLTDDINLVGMIDEVKKEDVWKLAKFEVNFVMLYYSAFILIDMVFMIFVKNRFLYLRKEAKSAQHSAGQVLIHNLKKRKDIRLRQKELYYEREELRRGSSRAAANHPSQKVD